jgi:hypothetical protein
MTEMLPTMTDVTVREYFPDEWVAKAIIEGLGPEGQTGKPLATLLARALIQAEVSDDVLLAILISPGLKLAKPFLDKADSPKAAAAAAREFIAGVRGLCGPPTVEQMNREWAAVTVGGKYRVARRVPNATYPRQQSIEFHSKTDFLSRCVHPRVRVVTNIDGKTKEAKHKEMDLGLWWLGQPHHSRFDGIIFKPAAPEVVHVGRMKLLNTYGGFSVEPINDDTGCAAYLQHVRDNICGGDPELVDYVLDWMASGVQYPDNPGRSALSLRGLPGTGKGVFAVHYGRLFGQHFLHVTNKDQVTGKFNAHSAEICLTLADESFFAQVAADANILKTLISEDTKLLERKGIDAVPIPNYSRHIFLTNDDHPLRIDFGDRRYCAIYVRQAAGHDDPDVRRAFFQQIIKEMENGGRAALLGLLLKRDISNFNPERIPETAERQEQKLLSAPAGDKVVIGFAQDGMLPGAIAGRPWIAQARGQHCLFDEMQRRGGSALQRMSEVNLADLLKRWGFKRHPLGYGTGWAAPALQDLRAAVKKRYPSVTWDCLRSSEWCAPTQDQRARSPGDLHEQAEVPF